MEIIELCNYVNTIAAEKKYFDIEFEKDQKIAYFHVAIKREDSLTGISSKTNIVADGDYNRGFISNKNLNIESSNVDNLLKWLGWTRDELTILKQKLDKANCISIEKNDDEEPLTIGYKRVDFGKYSYKIFDRTLSDSLINKYNDGCTYIYYKDNIVLEYRGGVIGPQCF